MMSRRAKLNSVRRFASQKESEAAERMATVVQELNSADKLLSDLSDYRVGYIESLSAKTNWNSSHWADSRDFLSRLEGAINAQQEIVDHHKAQLMHARQLWQQTKSRTKSLDQLDQKMLVDERLSADRIAQKEADARALLQSPMR